MGCTTPRNQIDHKEINTDQLIIRETETQETQALRVNTTMDKDNNKVSVEHLHNEVKSVDMKASLHEFLQETQTIPTNIEEKPEITTLTGEHAPKQVDNKLPAQVNHSKAKDEDQLLQLVSINPEVKALHKLATLYQGEPGTKSELIAKPICGVVQLHETSIHFGFWEHFTMFYINIFSKFAGKFAADVHIPEYMYPDTACPQTTLESLQSRGLLANHAPA